MVFRPPKTIKGRRTIALSPYSAQVLREHRESQEAMGQMLGKQLEDSDLVFSQVDGKPLQPDTVTHAWIKLVRRIGLRGIRFHDARHIHASRLLKQNVHPLVVSQRLGHAGVQITLDTYSHVTQGLQEAAARRFDEGLAPPQKARARNGLQ